MNTTFKIFVFILLSVSASAQLPETDIWLFKIKREKNKPPVLEDGKNITARKGYDNQPSFSPNGKEIFYSSVGNDGQADIFIYSISGKKSRAFTSSVESEYTPMQLVKDGKISSVTVEKDSAQRVHFINPLSGAHEDKFDIDSIGYYSFVNADTMAYYKLTEPHSLRYFIKSNQEDRLIATSPVRSFGPVNRHSLFFGIKGTDSVRVYIYDFHLRKSQLFAVYANLNEDLVWHSEWGLLRSEGTKILRFDVTNKTWVEVFNLEGSGIKKITRFAFSRSGKHVAVVDNQ